MRLPLLLTLVAVASAAHAASNPIINDIFTADPAPLVVGDTVYVYAGQDEAPPNKFYQMNRWVVYSSRDMQT